MQVPDSETLPHISVLAHPHCLSDLAAHKACSPSRKAYLWNSCRRRVGTAVSHRLALRTRAQARWAAVGRRAVAAAMAVHAGLVRAGAAGSHQGIAALHARAHALLQGFNPPLRPALLLAAQSSYTL